MGIFRLYTGNDGQSHLEDQTLSAHPALLAPQTATHIVFAQLPVGTFIDWHPAPRRQYVIILAGQLEIGLGDGTVRRFGPGDARLVEDTTGRGHTTRVVGPGPVLTAIIPLAEPAR
jgi:quercetin dioxygenase-like cupin family protein